MQEDLQIRHVRSREFRSASVDSAVVVKLSDSIADKLVISFSRTEIVTISERGNRGDGGLVNFVTGVTPETEVTRAVEFAVEIRPDHAAALVASIKTALNQLPADRRRIYGIPDAGI